MKGSIILLFFLGYSLLSTGSTVDTISIFSNGMHKSIKCVVIKPGKYKFTTAKFPVVYLLHGYGGWYSNIIIRIPQMQEYADTYQSIFVCPDGAAASWYIDSPVDSSYRYESYIVSDVVTYIDKNYKTIADRGHRAICGLSMGGQGAFFLALRHATVFGAAGSMSGAFDLLFCKDRFDLAKRIGDTVTHINDWHDLAVINLIEQYASTPVKLIFDCGNNDIFIEPNRHLHQKMLQLRIPHDYIERSGEHNWDYWRNAIPYQLVFFRKFFDSQ
jgi:S-formylglutathione hydrolase FrmB